jgi:acetyl-CoA carboxylase carboxyltransferase component
MFYGVNMPFEKELQDLKRRKEKALQMGGPEKIKRQLDKGKFTARERIARLLDPDSFFEVGMLNCSDMPGMEAKTPAYRGDELCRPGNRG